MMRQRWAIIAVVGVALGLGACGGDPEPEAPAPVAVDTAAERRAREAAAAEAARRAEQERLERERQARDRAMAEARRARETLTARVHFDFDQSTIRPDAEQVLRGQVAVLRAYPDVRLRITGHADERGSTEYNLALGQRRAAAAKRYLTDRGIDGGRIEIVSFGEERPTCTEEDESCFSRNRRDEFEITAGQVTATQTSSR